jgi:hypothetical protein
MRKHTNLHNKNGLFGESKKLINKQILKQILNQ